MLNIRCIQCISSRWKLEYPGRQRISLIGIFALSDKWLREPVWLSANTKHPLYKHSRLNITRLTCCVPTYAALQNYKRFRSAQQPTCPNRGLSKQTKTWTRDIKPTICTTRTTQASRWQSEAWIQTKLRRHRGWRSAADLLSDSRQVGRDLWLCSLDEQNPTFVWCTHSC